MELMDDYCDKRISKALSSLISHARSKQNPLHKLSAMTRDFELDEFKLAGVGAPKSNSSYRALAP